MAILAHNLTEELRGTTKDENGVIPPSKGEAGASLRGMSPIGELRV
jgi:hypothetical protein